MAVVGRTHSPKQTLKVEGHEVPVSNLEKVLYPASGFTKAHVINYYVRVAPFLLPHLKDRPVTLKRYPDGIAGEHFYEKDAPSFTPEWVQTFPVPRRSGKSDIHYILINDLRTLVWSANLANLEIHPFLHRVPRIDTPTMIAFDLDPGPGTDVITCAEVAFHIRELLDRLRLKAFPKVSGSKGIQLYVPLNTPTTYTETQAFARAVAQLLEQEHSDRVVSKMAKEVRTGKVFIDYRQNADFKTTVGVYSLRAKRDHPYVSMPVSWEELEEAVRARDHKRLYFDPDPAIRRLGKLGDLMAPVLRLKQQLPAGFTETLTRGTVAPRETPRSLETYESKRDFNRTSEPTAAVPDRSRQGSKRRFVVQKHAASHLHYDFRLEMHDVLKSWAVPKGIPLQLGERRLAMATEDHPIEYLDFEGTIPEGQYGGGTVMVWDIGTYEIVEGNYYKGSLHVHLNGKKLKGDWTIERDPGDSANKWKLAKAVASMKPLNAKVEDSSALTKRSMEEIAQAADATWHSNRSAAVAAVAGPRTAGAPNLRKLPETRARFIEPMLLQRSATLPEGNEWSYELKLDGYRAIGIKRRGEVLLRSRNDNDFSSKYPAVTSALAALPDETVVDGEVVALDEAGRPSFNVLQNYGSASGPLLYYVFDLMVLGGRDVMREPLSRRQEMLDLHVLPKLTDPIRRSPQLEASLPELIASVKTQGLEGLVAKRRDSIYEPGQRSGAWQKMRVNQGQEFVIGGYTVGGKTFDALVFGYYEGKKLMYAGRTRNGFTPRLRAELMHKFRGLERTECPFSNLPEKKSGRWGQGLTAAKMQDCRWLRPKLVGQFEFVEWTPDDHLRHSRFAGLREDKKASEVVREVSG